MLNSNRPIYFQLSGRLGNQLFQLAFAHQLAKQFDRKIQFFTDSIHYPDFNGSDLFSVNFTCKHVLSPIRMNHLGQFIRVLDKINSLGLSRFMKRITSSLGVHRQLDSHISDTPLLRAPWLVTGFYIDKAYVELNEEILHEEISFLIEHECRNSNLFEELASLGEYQVMHIRRGDYVNNPADFGILTTDYYELQRNDLPLILTLENEEDLQELQSLLKPRIILTKENSTVWETLLAMSQASDIVMSNSTFAWWGGFLSTNNGGIARMPTPFFKRSENVDRFFTYKYFSEIGSNFID